MNFKVCIVTGGRAEYELLKPIMTLFQKSESTELQVVVTCMHLSPEFGLTVQLIEEDKLPIADRIEMLLSADTNCAIAKSTGLAMLSFADCFRRLEPNILVVLGDRFEILGAVTAAFIMNIPVVHLYGGETTVGALDEGFRHAITKMSYLHFTATEEYRRRVIQLGEEPQRVFNVGSLGVENIKKMNLLSKDILQKELSFNFREKNVLVTFHSSTLETGVSKEQFRNLLTLLSTHKDLGIIFTKTNADPAGRILNQMIDDFMVCNSDRSIVFYNMGQLKYFSTMQFVNTVIGNSSSGIIEAPSFGIGTINIGDRQAGRIKAQSIIDCCCDIHSIKFALELVFSPDFSKNIQNIHNPYEKEDTAKRIYEVIVNCLQQGIFLKKRFYDINILGQYGI